MTKLTAILVIFSLAAAVGKEHDTTLIAKQSAELWKKPKKKGSPLAMLDHGLEVILTGEKKGKLLEVKTTQPFEIVGWVSRSETGCRITEDTEVKEKPKKEEKPDGEPILRKGAMVKILKTKGDWMQVEATPYPIKIFTFNPSKKDEMTSETVFTGFTLRGWIPASHCAADVAAYYDSTPKEGELKSFVDETIVYAEKPEDESSKSQQVSGKALKYCRWVELEQQEDWSRGYTDGPVVIKGWVMNKQLGPLPNTNPLYTIFLKEFKDFEIMISTDLKTLDNKKLITKLPGGMEVYKVGVDYEGCIVKTGSPIIVEGLVNCKHLRNLGYLPEKVMEDTKKNPQVTFPERGPKTRKKIKKK